LGAAAATFVWRDAGSCLFVDAAFADAAAFGAVCAAGGARGRSCADGVAVCAAGGSDAGAGAAAGGISDAAAALGGVTLPATTAARAPAASSGAGSIDHHRHSSGNSTPALMPLTTHSHALLRRLPGSSDDTTGTGCA
jgi:hypothetical protein